MWCRPQPRLQSWSRMARRSQPKRSQLQVCGDAILWNHIFSLKDWMENYQIKHQIIIFCKNPSFFWSLDADGKKKVETFVEEEEGAAGFGEDFFKNRIRLLTFIFIALSLIFNFIFTVNLTFNFTSIFSLLLSLLITFIFTSTLIFTSKLTCIVVFIFILNQGVQRKGGLKRRWEKRRAEVRGRLSFNFCSALVCLSSAWQYLKASSSSSDEHQCEEEDTEKENQDGAFTKFQLESLQAHNDLRSSRRNNMKNLTHL